MAKLTGPLFSLTASGKLAGSLVYGDWKGINYVRQRVIPANPNSAGQQTQRSYFTLAVNQWHSTTEILNSTDIANLNFEASLSASPLSGFNLYVKQYVNTKIAGVTPTQLYGTSVGTPSGGGVTINANSGVTSNDHAIKYGTSKRALVNSQAHDGSGTPTASPTFTLSGLTPGVVYYFKIYKSTTDAEHALGVGSFTAA